ncbi:hypothetical protein HZ993_19795 [Rhodoferax sp. AJA081-3]|uniref:hypothetical protein n=1 Tax=Rhodoferax sp. AJA081-3 TaxID=2752316 RepID=UPI001ADF6A7C|nr:hypothetical protein [Rhodoferax sp. AJA081-3]QTN27489.1 hypothetical protein HZ993_19795 [Rhodoferax sp. AJA081-3]
MKISIHKLSRSMALVAMAFASVHSHAVDAFDSKDGLLTLDRVKVGGTTFRSIVATVNAYTLVGVAGGAPVENTFDTTTNTLVMGEVAHEGVTYNNVTVVLRTFTLRSSGNTVIGSSTLATHQFTGEMAGYFNALNRYRTQCGIEALAENTVLDGIAPSVGTATTPSTLASGAGYPSWSTVGAVSSTYLSNSSNAALVGEYELQIALMDPAAMLTLMRPYTQIGMASSLGNGAVNQRGAKVVLGTPVSRNMPGVVTFPCANTTDIAPFDPANTGSVSYVGPVYGQFNDDHLVTGAQGTPIGVYANVGVALTSATVTARGGTSVPVKLKSGTMVYPTEGYVWPQAKLLPNTTYDVVINGTLGGSYNFTKRFAFKTGAAIPEQNLP